MSTVVVHGARSSHCPQCGVLFAYWDEEDLDDNGALLCYCEEGMTEQLAHS